MRYRGWIALLLAASPGGVGTAMAQAAPTERTAATQGDADFARFGVLALLEGRQFRVTNRFVGDPSTRSSTAKFYWLDERRTKLREIRILATTRGGTPAMVEMMSDWSLGAAPGELVEYGVLANGKSYTMTYRLSADGSIKATAVNPISKFMMELVIGENELAKRFSTRSGKYLGSFVYAEEAGAFDQDASVMPGYNARMARQRREELAEERRRGQALFDIYLRAITPRAPVVASPGISGGVAGTGDMGGSTYRAAPRMTPEQQAKADELERFKMREQARTGQAPTTFAEDARAKTDAQNRRLAAERAERQRVAEAETARRGDAVEAQRRADAAEAKRKADEARAEQARKDKLAADAVAREKREAAAKLRAENEPVEWKEGVVLCAPPKAPSRNATCHGPLQTTWGSLGEASGRIAVAQACGTRPENTREIGQAAGFIAFGCGYGIHPANTMRTVPLHGDPVARLGVGYVDGRRIYRCPRKQTDVCTTP